MKKTIIRLTEGDIHKIVKESVKMVLKEYGNTPEGQKKLGGLHARTVLNNDNVDDWDEIYRYAEKNRGGDNYDKVGNNENPMYYDYAQGYVDYLDSHPNELAASNHRRMKRNV